MSLIATRAYSDGLPGTGIADFYYNRATGAMFFDTDGQTAVSMLLEGPPATSIDRFTGVDSATGTSWIQDYFANKEQWIELSLTGVQGVFKIATYPSGLIETDFLSAEYGTLGGGIEFTDVTLLEFAGDFDRDGDVDGTDFLVWQRNPSVGSLAEWQTHYGSGSLAAVAAVPEPSSVVLLLTLVTVSGFHRQRTFAVNILS
ncbi:PEP-CTERM sorting domain-containing protein [Bythopirellula polymerisocia]|uniref:PEP-CTERM sorting domain-containing protein n=1 Tax=Bythopirellula polymerisocia TaxID=2528003 RepID=UPI0018D4A87D|nr:PEP-CTERM sorting domain-containing protein [Bythopirellula polymerisocia]